MIHLVDLALGELIHQALPQYEVDFGPPKRDKPLGQTAGTEAIGIYLYDIRESLDRRQAGTIYHTVPNEHPKKQKKVEYHDPPRFAQLSYLITAWAPDPLVSHSMLGEVLILLSKRNELSLLPIGPSVTELSAHLDISRPPIDERVLAELWNVTGLGLVPALNITVILPLPSFVVAPYEHWVKEELIVDDSHVEFPNQNPPPHWKKWPPKSADQPDCTWPHNVDETEVTA